MSPAETLFVFFGADDEACGQLRRADDGRVRFRYVEGATRRLSHSLPLTLGTAEVDGVFFENLLPDGIERERLARRLGVSDASTYRLLEAVGGDCAGAISILPTSTRPSPSPSLRPLEPSLLAEIEAHGVAPALVTLGLRLSLAGAQSKLAVVVDGDQLLLPLGSTASTHILKLPNPSFSHLVDNEHFVMTLARHARLQAPSTRMVSLPSGRPALLVERFDRSGGRRLHQEDFCQARGLHPTRKYEVDGGPGLATIVEILTSASVEPLDPLALVRIQAFNVVVGNNDGHAKNLALLREPDVRFAPPYDLVCTRAWPHLSGALALSVGGIFDAGNVGPRAWATFAAQTRMSAKAVIAVAADVTERVAAALPGARAEAVDDGADAGVVAHLAGLIEGFVQRSRHLHAVERPEPRVRRAPRARPST
jgi:serine/threonine-protein kinase HipA